MRRRGGDCQGWVCGTTLAAKKEEAERGGAKAAGALSAVEGMVSHLETALRILIACCVRSTSQKLGTVVFRASRLSPLPKQRCGLLHRSRGCRCRRGQGGAWGGREDRLGREAESRGLGHRQKAVEPPCILVYFVRRAAQPGP